MDQALPFTRLDWRRIARGASALSEIADRVLVAHPRAERFGFRGDWDLQLIDGETGLITARRKFKNLIVNAGLDRIKDRMFNPSTSAAGFFYIAIGAGAVAEVATDTALGSELARGATTYTAGGTGVATIDRTFAAGTGTGTVTEVGAFDAAAAGNMLNRKTFSAITKAAGDALKASCVLTATAV